MLQLVPVQNSIRACNVVLPGRAIGVDLFAAAGADQVLDIKPPAGRDRGGGADCEEIL